MIQMMFWDFVAKASIMARQVRHHQPEGYATMSERPPDELASALRERGIHYIVGTGGEPVGVLLALDEYEHYLDLLDDEADSQDPELARRLAQATSRPTDEERLDFRAYLSQRQG